jgi:short-subunit dehydrogenase
LVGRHADALIAAKNTFELLYKVHVKIFELDLSLPGSTEVIASWCNHKKLPLKLLCNVAGLGGKMDFLNMPLNKLRTMVSLNVSSQMALSLDLLPLLEENAPSNILNVASMAGFAPIPEKNLYSATKASVIFFSYALHYQLKKKRVSVSCLCPGPVFTKPEIKKDTIEKLGRFGKLMAVTPTKVGETAVQDTLEGKMIIIPGTLAKMMSVISRLLPRRVITSIYFAMGQK